MEISKDNTPERIKRSKACTKFVSDLGANFPIGVFINSSQVTLGNRYDVWRMERSQDDKHSDFIAMCVTATKSAPDYLSYRQNNDTIDTIASVLGRSKRLRKKL